MKYLNERAVAKQCCDIGFVIATEIANDKCFQTIYTDRIFKLYKKSCIDFIRSPESDVP